MVHFFLLSRIGRGHILCADGLAGYDHIHTAVLLAPVGGVIRGDGIVRTETLGIHGTGRHALRDQVLANCVGPLLRELLVEIQGAGVVGISIDFDLDVGIGDQDSSHLGQALAGVGGQIGAVESEENVGHVDD